METQKHSFIKWRENELILVTVYCLLGIAGYWWQIFEHTGAELRKNWGYRFAENHFPFDFFRNVLLPHTALLILIYVCYFWMNLYILPRLMQAGAAEPGGFRVSFSLRGRVEFAGPAGVTLKRTLWGVVNAILLMILLGVGWGVVIYYQQPYTFAGMDYTNQVNRLLGMGWRNSAMLVVLYSGYAIFRELSIRRLQADPRRNGYHMLVVNQISIYAAIYFSIGCVLYDLSIIDDKGFYIIFFGVAPPLLLAGIVNLYWIYPMAGEGSFWQRKNLRRVLFAAFAWNIPFAFWMADNSNEVVAALMTMWAGQLSVVTTVSWLVYRSRRSQFMRLRGLEAALGRSQADLQFLRSQINPHFLFNALNTLYGTALQEDAPRTAGGVQQLGDMMRFMLHENNRDKIPMSKEVEYLKNYIALQRLRTDSSPQIRIETEIDDVLPDAMIAPMLLVPFVENAFKHGISLREASWVNIRLHGEGKQLLFEVRNSVHTRQANDPEKDKSGIGLIIVLHRLNLLYPARHSFFMNQDEREFFVQLMIEP
jgi:two-component system LytT family sensor kinase